MITKKLAIILLLFIISNVLFLNINVSNADFSLDSIIKGGKSFLDSGKEVNQTINEANLKSVSDGLFNSLLLIASSIAIIIGIVLGIQFMLATVEEKAEIKKAIIPYVIGCAVAFGAFGIWKLIVSILSAI